MPADAHKPRSAARTRERSSAEKVGEGAGLLVRLGRGTTLALVVTVALGLAVVGLISSQGFSTGLPTSAFGPGQVLDLGAAPGPEGVARGDGVSSLTASTAAGDGGPAASSPQAAPPTSGPSGGGPVSSGDGGGAPTGSPAPSGSAALPGAGVIVDPGTRAPQTPQPVDPGTGPSGPGDPPAAPGTGGGGSPVEEPPGGEDPDPAPDPDPGPGTPVDEPDDGGEDGEGSIPVEDGDGGEDSGGDVSGEGPVEIPGAASPAAEAAVEAADPPGLSKKIRD